MSNDQAPMTNDGEGMNHEGTKDTKGVALGPTLIRIAIRSMLIVFVIASALFLTVFVRFWWLTSVYRTALEEQWALLEPIDPEMNAHNVWGNAVQSTYYPINHSPKPLSEMRSLTNSLREIVSSTGLGDVEKRRLAYELLLSDSTNKDFVERHASHFGITAED